MTHKIHKPRSIRRTLRYVVHKSGAERIAGSVEGRSPEEIARTMGLVARLHPKLRRKVFHASLSAADGEHLTAEQWTAIAHEYMREMGFGRAMYVVFRHTDSGQDHVHIVALRLSLDGQVISDRNDYQKGMEILRRIEARHGLVPMRPRDPDGFGRELSWPDLDRIRRGKLLFHRQAAQDLVADLRDATSWADLAQRFAARGYTLQRVRQGLVIAHGSGGRAALSRAFPGEASLPLLNTRFNEGYDDFAQRQQRDAAVPAERSGPERAGARVPTAEPGRDRGADRAGGDAVRHAGAGDRSPGAGDGRDDGEAQGVRRVDPERRADPGVGVAGEHPGEREHGRPDGEGRGAGEGLRATDGQGHGAAAPAGGSHRLGDQQRSVPPGVAGVASGGDRDVAASPPAVLVSEHVPPDVVPHAGTAPVPPARGVLRPAVPENEPRAAGRLEGAHGAGGATEDPAVEALRRALRQYTAWEARERDRTQARGELERERTRLERAKNAPAIRERASEDLDALLRRTTPSPTDARDQIERLRSASGSAEADRQIRSRYGSAVADQARRWMDAEDSVLGVSALRRLEQTVAQLEQRVIDRGREPRSRASGTALRSEIRTLFSRLSPTQIQRLPPSDRALAERIHRERERGGSRLPPGPSRG